MCFNLIWEGEVWNVEEKEKEKEQEEEENKN